MEESDVFKIKDDDDDEESRDLPRSFGSEKSKRASHQAADPTKLLKQTKNVKENSVNKNNKHKFHKQSQEILAE